MTGCRDGKFAAASLFSSFLVNVAPVSNCMILYPFIVQVFWYCMTKTVDTPTFASFVVPRTKRGVDVPDFYYE